MKTNPTVSSLLEKISKNKEKLRAERIDTEEGDSWGVEYVVRIPNVLDIVIGRMIIIEDDENWAQAESYESSYIKDYHTGDHLDIEYVSSCIDEYLIVIERDQKIDSINEETS